MKLLCAADMIAIGFMSYGEFVAESAFVRFAFLILGIAAAYSLGWMIAKSEDTQHLKKAVRRA